MFFFLNLQRVEHSDKKMFIFYTFTIKRPIFFFGKMPRESNRDDEPAFKKLQSLQTKNALLEKTIAY